MENKDTAQCIVCQSPLEYFQRGATSLSRCSACGLVALHPVPSDAERAAYYAQHYALNADIPKQRYAAEQRRWSRQPEQLKLIRDIKNIMPPPATIVDIGCDRAAFLDEARRYGYGVMGVEPSESARRDALGIGIPVYASLEELQHTVQQGVDAVCMWHSLEHVANPPAMLRSLHELLNPKGIIAIRVPDFASVWSSLLRQHWIWFQPQNHSYHFSLPSLGTLLERSGFELLHLCSQRPNSFLTLRSTALAAKSFARYAGMHSSLKRILSGYYEYLTGIELYAIARKKG